MSLSHLSYTEVLIRQDQLTETRQICEDDAERHDITGALARIEDEIERREAESLTHISYTEPRFRDCFCTKR